MVKIETFDKYQLDVDYDILECSQFFKNLLEFNQDSDEIIPLNDSSCSKKNIELLIDIISNNKDDITFNEYCELVKISNFLQISDLLKKSSEEIAKSISKCNNEDELKELFGEMRELTSDEEADIKKEYDKICG